MANVSDQDREFESIKLSLSEYEGLTENNRKDILRFFNHMEAKGISPKIVNK